MGISLFAVKFLAPSGQNEPFSPIRGFSPMLLVVLIFDKVGEFLDIFHNNLDLIDCVRTHIARGYQHRKKNFELKYTVKDSPVFLFS